VFTGLIETQGTVRAITSRQGGALLAVSPGLDDFEVPVGASVAINGACLTLERREKHVCVFTAVQETLRRTTIGGLRVGDQVNMERALRLSDRLDGHVVLGHVDGVGTIVSDRHEGESLVRTIEVPQALRMYMAEKGSVAIDGISLTIASGSDGRIALALIPHTIANTTMAIKRVGDKVNVECDVLARYLVHLLRNGATASDESRDESLITKMRQAGF
jgi:riboflavin synthase